MKKKKNFSQQQYAIFVKKNFSEIKNQKIISKSEIIVISLENIAVQLIINLSCRKPLILPVIFHNLQGYDAHLFIKKLAKVQGDFFSIPTTEEKYITFSKFIAVDQYYSKKREKVLFKKFEMRFIDSFKFLQTSLANLVSNLQPSDYKNLQKNIKTNCSLLARKGVYPYDYITSIEQLKETKLTSSQRSILFKTSQ